MGFLWRKQEKVETMLENYFAGCDKCFDLFEEAFAIYMESGLGQAFTDAIEETHQSEAAADDMRREIEYTLYGKALLPDSRGDILGLLETFDRMPGFAENVLFAIESQRLQIKAKFQKDIKKLVEVNVQAYRLARKAVEMSPDSGAYYDTLAHVYFGQGDFENAVKYQARAAELEPHSGMINKQLQAFCAKLDESRGRQDSDAAQTDPQDEP